MPPYLTPLQIFENYKKTNPKKCKGKSTTEICRLAGLSDKQIAELKSTSAWLFCFDKENTNSNQDFSMTKIFGGDFSTKKSNRQPKPSTNTKQYSKIAPELLVDNKGKIDVKQFSLEALKKKYDSKNYTIKKVDSEFVNGTYNYEIRDKKNNLICLIDNYDDGSFSYEKFNGNERTLYFIDDNGYISLMSKDFNYKADSFHQNKYSYSYDKNGHILESTKILKDVQTTKCYDENGNLTEVKQWKFKTADGSEYDYSKMQYYKGRAIYKYSGDGKDQNLLAQDFHKCITDGNYNEFKILRKFIDYKTIDNLLYGYERAFGITIDDGITDSIKLTAYEKKQVLDYLKDVKAIKWKFKAPLEKQQIINSHYKGGEYKIKKVGRATVEIENLKMQEVQRIDLNEFVKNIPIRQKDDVLRTLIKLPAEVLLDLNVEMTKPFLDGKKEKSDGAAAFYRGSSNMIALGVNNSDYSDKELLVHELGHAVDFNGIFSNEEESLTAVKPIFDKELKAYIASGHKQSEGAGEDKCSTTTINGKEVSTYATTDHMEMFAECYTLLMLGDCQSKTVIEKYFPKSLQAVKEQLPKIRAKHKIIRRSVANM